VAIPGLATESAKQEREIAMASLVYVVDDEKVIATTLAAILNHSGFEAIAFLDPLEALRSAEERCPDVLITDVMMPQLNGIDLGIQFKSIFPQCRVLLFSGQAATSDLLKDARSKGHDFNLLTKPVHPSDLLAAIKGLRD
jgi:DNA-binding response OmpR family regulator